MALSAKQAKKLQRLLNTLDRARQQMENAELRDLVCDWRGSMNLRENINEFIQWQSRKLPAEER